MGLVVENTEQLKPRPRKRRRVPLDGCYVDQLHAECAVSGLSEARALQRIMDRAKSLPREQAMNRLNGVLSLIGNRVADLKNHVPRANTQGQSEIREIEANLKLLPGLIAAVA